MNRLSSLALTGICALLAQAAVSQEDTPMIASGSIVELEYTLTLTDGSLVYSNIGKEPIRYVHGEGSLFPALEAAFVGHAAHDEIQVELSPDQAYGPVKAELLQDVPVEDIPEDARKVGSILRAPNFEGAIRVREVREDTVVLDFNHPLAGEDLKFNVRVVTVEPGRAVE